jgi:hypothetical protein
MRVVCTSCKVSKHPTLYSMRQLRSDSPRCKVCIGNPPKQKFVEAVHYCSKCKKAFPASSLTAEQLRSSRPQCNDCITKSTVDRPFACKDCRTIRPASAFSNTQLTKSINRRCKQCVAKPSAPPAPEPIAMKQCISCKKYHPSTIFTKKQNKSSTPICQICNGVGKDRAVLDLSTCNDCGIAQRAIFFSNKQLKMSPPRCKNCVKVS